MLRFDETKQSNGDQKRRVAGSARVRAHIGHHSDLLRVVVVDVAITDEQADAVDVDGDGDVDYDDAQEIAMMADMGAYAS